MARSLLHTSPRRLLSFSILVAVFIWYRTSKLHEQKFPRYDIVDFKIRDYNTQNPIPLLDERLPASPRPTASAPKSSMLSYDDLQQKVRSFIQWNRPWTDHWPAWHDYDSTEYDPNRWEGMERETGYFHRDSVQELEHKGIQPEPYLPYPDYNSKSWREKWYGDFHPCVNAQGLVFGEDESLEHVVKGYRRPFKDFPRETVGSSEVIGLDTEICFDRYSRYAPYSLSEDFTSINLDDDHVSKHMSWDRVRWGYLQDMCMVKNQERFRPDARAPVVLQPSTQLKPETDAELEDILETPSRGESGQKFHSRTAVLIRTWEGYQYQENDIQAIRSLITELSLLSGGEYQVYLFVNIKQKDADIYNDPEIYQDILKRTVPQELRDIAVLWTEAVCELWYPKVGDWQVYWMQFMPVQWFSKTHPEFDYVWNWETDARYIGNHYHFLEQITAFARGVPRKHLWERNARFYLPDEWNGDYKAYLADTDKQIINATLTNTIDEPVWGPRPYAPFQKPLGPEPPRSQEEDNFEWGVGEEADLITLQPIWDPSETEWSYRNHIFNYIPSTRPNFTPENGNDDGFNHPGFSTIPRRVFINTLARFSKRMLAVMHEENLAARSMQAEMFPATVALHHGLKAVYAPQPIWTDRKWPSWYADAVFNANNGNPARWGQQIDSPYSHDREANFGGWSWYYRSVFPTVLFRRWLGWKAHDFGWDFDLNDEQELREKEELAVRTGLTMDQLEDVRMCLPGILLHPVKNVWEGADGG